MAVLLAAAAAAFDPNTASSSSPTLLEQHPSLDARSWQSFLGVGDVKWWPCACHGWFFLLPSVCVCSWRSFLVWVKA